MPTSRIQTVSFFSDLPLAGGASRTTKTIDVRVDVPRIEAIIARGISASAQPDFTVYWYGGVDTEEIDGTATGGTDRFQPFNANDPLINTNPSGTHPEGSEDYLIAPVPALLWPYIRLRLVNAGGSPSDSIFSLFGVFRRHFGV